MGQVNPLAGGGALPVKQSIRRAAPWVERLARLGYFAKGVVYIVMGLLALDAAATGQHRTTNNQGAITQIGNAPFGRFLLAIVGLGLACYALWRLMAALLDVEDLGTSRKGAVTRAGYFISGMGYGALALTAFSVLTGRQSNGNAQQDWTARLMSAPAGAWMVGLLDLIIICYGLAQIGKGWKGKVSDDLDLHDAAPAHRDWIIRCGRLGYAARGVVFAIVGGFFIHAAMNANPKEAKGLGSALDLVAEQPFGKLLLAITAAGLAAYGLFMLAQAKYRKIDIEGALT